LIVQFAQNCGSTFEIFCIQQLEHKAAIVTCVNPHIARPINI